MSIAIVTGSIAPYTNRLYNAFAARTGEDLHVFTCIDIEPERHWKMPVATHYRLTPLPGLRVHNSDTSHVFVNPSVIPALQKLKPDMIIVAGHFSPTMMMAAAFARTTGRPYGISTDGSRMTDPGETSRRHAAVRRLLIPHATFGIGASEASVDLLTHWGLAPSRCVVMPLVSGWPAPTRVPTYHERPYDVLFAGSINEPRKGALFFADVLTACKEAGRPLRARVVGEGPDRGALLDRLVNAGIEVRFDGYLQQEQLPEAYSSAKLFAFPSRSDAWGLVANEALLCGTPVIGSPHAVSSNELVARYGVGLVHRLDVETWRDAILDTLASPEQWRGFMRRRSEAMASFSLDRSVAALHNAITLGRTSRRAPVLAI